MKISDVSKGIVSIIEGIREGVVSIYTFRPSFDLFFGFREVAGAGSGFIVSDNFVVTNAHVVRGAERVNVLFPDGERGEARVAAADPSRDLALLYVRTGGRKPLRLGDSDELKVGELVFAVGSPLGLPGPSVTMGVVSALGRTIEARSLFLEDLIQTDAAINPGNSGGPLINASGEVVGVTTAIVPYAQGIGFAIPINSVKRFLHILSKYGRPVRAWIGVYVTTVNKEVATAYHLPTDRGVLVVQVVPGTPAHRYGIRQGDIIVRAAGREVRRASELREAVEDSIDRECVELEVVRGTKQVKLCVPVIAEYVD